MNGRTRGDGVNLVSGNRCFWHYKIPLSLLRSVAFTERYGTMNLSLLRHSLLPSGPGEGQDNPGGEGDLLTKLLLQLATANVSTQVFLIVTYNLG